MERQRMLLRSQRNPIWEMSFAFDLEEKDSVEFLIKNHGETQFDVNIKAHSGDTYIYKDHFQEIAAGSEVKVSFAPQNVSSNSELREQWSVWIKSIDVLGERYAYDFAGGVGRYGEDSPFHVTINQGARMDTIQSEILRSDTKSP